METPNPIPPQTQPQASPEPQPQTPMPPPPQPKRKRNIFPAIIITALLVVSLVSAACIYSLNQQVSSMQNQITLLQDTLSLYSTSAATAASASNVSLSALYKQVANSVVTIDCTIITTYTYNNPFGQGRTYTQTEQVQGSGFVTLYNGQYIIITNNHVVDGADSITVTFSNGNQYTATVLGADSTLDLAILQASAPTSAYHALAIASSSTVNIGDAVMAIGSPYGLNGTMTTGIISALDRSITITEESTSTSYTMTGLIQTSAPINSGNSGGPLMTYDGKVIGITTAIVSNSDGLGFAVPSDTILSYIQSVLD